MHSVSCWRGPELLLPAYLFIDALLPSLICRRTRRWCAVEEELFNEVVRVRRRMGAGRRLELVQVERGGGGARGVAHGGFRGRAICEQGSGGVCCKSLAYGVRLLGGHAQFGVYCRESCWVFIVTVIA